MSTIKHKKITCIVDSLFSKETYALQVIPRIAYELNIGAEKQYIIFKEELYEGTETEHEIVFERKDQDWSKIAGAEAVFVLEESDFV